MRVDREARCLTAAEVEWTAVLGVARQYQGGDSPALEIVVCEQARGAAVETGAGRGRPVRLVDSPVVNAAHWESSRAKYRARASPTTVERGLPCLSANASTRSHTSRLRLMPRDTTHVSGFARCFCIIERRLRYWQSICNSSLQSLPTLPGSLQKQGWGSLIQAPKCEKAPRSERGAFPRTSTRRQSTARRRTSGRRPTSRLRSRAGPARWGLCRCRPACGARSLARPSRGSRAAARPAGARGS